LNNEPIIWHSKKQGTIKSSIFGAEFIAMNSGLEFIRRIRYKLRMMGIPNSGPSNFFSDNMSVIQNTSKPESMLKQKCNSICYHAICEIVAMGETSCGYIRSENNVADICTKIIPGGQKLDGLVSQVLNDYGPKQ